MLHVISTEDIRVVSKGSYAKRTAGAGIISRFFSWCDSQERNRFLWLGIALMGGIGAVLPLTLFAIIMGAGNSFTLWVIACTLNVPVLITNLSAQPTKITLPSLFFAWLVDGLIIGYCVALLIIN